MEASLSFSWRSAKAWARERASEWCYRGGFGGILTCAKNVSRNSGFWWGRAIPTLYAYVQNVHIHGRQRKRYKSTYKTRFSQREEHEYRKITPKKWNPPSPHLPIEWLHASDSLSEFLLLFLHYNVAHIWVYMVINGIRNVAEIGVHAGLG